MEEEVVDIGEKKEERETQNKGINIVIIKMIKIALLEFCIYITLGCICEIKIGKEQMECNFLKKIKLKESMTIAAMVGSITKKQWPIAMEFVQDNSTQVEPSEAISLCVMVIQ